jgi:hypothetical protein
MTDDIRCCGTGTCIINEDGFCWCGQQWDGHKMCFPEPQETKESASQGDAEPVPRGE